MKDLEKNYWADSECALSAVAAAVLLTLDHVSPAVLSVFVSPLSLRPVVGVCFKDDPMAQLVSRGLASADSLLVVLRIPAGPLGSLKCDPPKGNGRRPKKNRRSLLRSAGVGSYAQWLRFVISGILAGEYPLKDHGHKACVVFSPQNCLSTSRVSSSLIDLQCSAAEELPRSVSWSRKDISLTH